MPPYQQPQAPYGQPNSGQEKHIFYGPDGQVLPGPPPGFALDGSKPRDSSEFPQDFAIEGVLDYGRLRAVQLMDNTKRFPKIPDYLHREMMMKYKQFKRTFVRIVSRGGDVHVHATPFIDRAPPVLEEVERPRVRYEYVPVYVDENDDIIDDPRRIREDGTYGTTYKHEDDGRVRELDRFAFSREDGRRYGRYDTDFGERYRVRDLDDDGDNDDVRPRRLPYDAVYGEPYIARSGRGPRTEIHSEHRKERPYYSSMDDPDRYRIGDTPRTVVNPVRTRRIEMPSTDY